MIHFMPKSYSVIHRGGTIWSIQRMGMGKYFVQVILAIALAAFSFPAYSESCSSSFSTFSTLYENLIEYIDSGEATNGGVLRRSDSVRRSLIAVKVYCSQNAEVIILANDIEGWLDEIDQAARGG